MFGGTWLRQSDYLSQKNKAADMGCAVRGFQCAGIAIQDSVGKIIDGIGCIQKRITFSDDAKHPSNASCRTLDPIKIYLDSCARYNSMSVRWALDNITPSNVHLW